MTELATIADAVDSLCNPIRHTERIYEPNAYRHKRLRRVWTTTHPSLLDQLALAVYPGETYVEDDTATRGVPGPTPPARLEAINHLLQIEAGAALWMARARLQLRDSATNNLRAMVGAHLDSSDAQSLLHDLRRWYGWAATLTGWENPPWIPDAPCPLCNARTLRVRLERKTATCISCGETWTEDTIGLLGDHIAALVEARPDTSALRTAAIAQRRARERYEKTRPDLPYFGSAS